MRVYVCMQAGRHAGRQAGRYVCMFVYIYIYVYMYVRMCVWGLRQSTKLSPSAEVADRYSAAAFGSRRPKLGLKASTSWICTGLRLIGCRSLAG